MNSEQSGTRGSGGQDPGARPKGAPGRARPSPQRAPPTAIALQAEDLATWVVERSVTFPREHRFTLGERLVQASLDALEALVEASYRRDRLAPLAAADRALVRLRILGRLAERFRCLSHAQAAHLGERSLEMGRMLGGWLRHARAASTPAAPPTGGAPPGPEEPPPPAR